MILSSNARSWEEANIRYNFVYLTGLAGKGQESERYQ